MKAARRNRRRKLIALILFCAGCGLGLAGLLMLPQHLPALLGLEPAGPLSSLLSADPGTLAAAGSPLDSIEVSLPPHIDQPVHLSAAGMEGLVLTGGQTTAGESYYRIEITERALTDLLERWCVPGGVAGSGCSQIRVDLQPGGLLLSRQIVLGPIRTWVGLLLRQEDELAAAAVMLGEELYGLPDDGLVAQVVSEARSDLERLMQSLSVVGPLPGQAHVEDSRFHDASLEILATVPGGVRRTGDTGWRSAGRGVETREITVRTAAGSQPVFVVRLDPAQVAFSVRYQPREPLPLSAWSEQLGALLVFNAGYFSEDAEAIYLVLADGQAYGTPLPEFGGMFAVEQDGAVGVRWLAQSPYAPQDPPATAVQSFPILLKPGGIMAFGSDADDGSRSRRTAVARDLEGRILVIVAPGSAFSLHELAVFLAEGDLSIDVALNLDGGGSTGLYLSAGDASVEIDSISPVPCVIAAELR
jgi:hypothetical protein